MAQPKVIYTQFGYNAGAMTKLNRNGYYGANYPSIFSMPYSPARYAPQIPMPSYSSSGSGTNFWQVLGGLTSLAAIVLPFMMLFKSNKSQESSGAKESKEAEEQKEEPVGQDLDDAVSKADKSGDWAPVKAELDAAKATLETKKAEIEKCDDEINTANDSIKSFNNEVAKLEANNKDITEKQIPDLEAKANTELADCDASIETLETSLTKSENSAPAMQTNIKKQIDDLKDKKVKIKEALEANKVQLQDKIKQNNTKIAEYKGSLLDAKKLIETKTKEKTTLEKDKNKLESKIKKIEAEYTKHTVKVDIPEVDPVTATTTTSSESKSTISQEMSGTLPGTLGGLNSKTGLSLQDTLPSLDQTSTQTEQTQAPTIFFSTKSKSTISTEMSGTLPGTLGGLNLKTGLPLESTVLGSKNTNTSTTPSQAQEQTPTQTEQTKTELVKKRAEELNLQNNIDECHDLISDLTEQNKNEQDSYKKDQNKIQIGILTSRQNEFERKLQDVQAEIINLEVSLKPYS